MDPATITAVTQEVWKVGGIVGVLLLLLVSTVFIFGRFLFRLVSDLGARLDRVQQEKTEILVTHIQESAEGLQAMVVETRAQTQQLHEITTALRARPCLIESGQYPKPSLPSTMPHQRNHP